MKKTFYYNRGMGGLTYVLFNLLDAQHECHETFTQHLLEQVLVSVSLSHFCFHKKPPWQMACHAIVVAGTCCNLAEKPKDVAVEYFIFPLRKSKWQWADCPTVDTRSTYLNS